MSSLRIVGLSGNITQPSKTRRLVETALDLATERLQAQGEALEIADFGAGLFQARRLDDLAAPARALVDRILTADALVVATPIYKGSYPGLFKHLVDLLDPAALVNKPVLVAATGGGEKHALAVEHQLRPLFAFFEARVLPTAVHVSDKDFLDGVLVGQAALTRLGRAVAQFDDIFPNHIRRAAAAE